MAFVQDYFYEPNPQFTSSDKKESAAQFDTIVDVNEAKSEIAGLKNDAVGVVDETKDVVETISSGKNPSSKLEELLTLTERRTRRR